MTVYCDQYMYLVIDYLIFRCNQRFLLQLRVFLHVVGYTLLSYSKRYLASGRQISGEYTRYVIRFADQICYVIRFPDQICNVVRFYEVDQFSSCIVYNYMQSGSMKQTSCEVRFYLKVEQCWCQLLSRRLVQQLYSNYMQSGSMKIQLTSEVPCRLVIISSITL